MPADKIRLDTAKKDKLFYFVANVVVYRKSDQRCLILKRSDDEKVHPGKYCVPGGKLEHINLDIQNPTRLNGDVLDFENAVEDLLAREVKEETGIEIESKIHYINSVAFVRPDGIPVILVKFTTNYKNGDIVLEPSFTDHAWVTAEEVTKYDCIQGIYEEIKQATNLFTQQ
jgi:8-oxo-dGTP pyrophosphatase MutT (NUDIX family)